MLVRSCTSCFWKNSKTLHVWYTLLFLMCVLLPYAHIPGWNLNVKHDFLHALPLQSVNYQPALRKKENTVLKTSIIAVSSKRNELHKYKVRRSVNVFFSARISLSSQEGPWSNNTLFGIARQSTTTICWEDILMNGFRWFPHGRLSAADVPPKWLFPHSVSVKSYCLSCPQELRLCARLLFSYPPRLI